MNHRVIFVNFDLFMVMFTCCIDLIFYQIHSNPSILSL